MASVDTDIANLALGMIGNDTGIATLNENSKEARACLRFYDQALGESLEAYDWPFARGYARGVQPSGYEVMPGYTYGYMWPSAALAIRGIARDIITEPDTEFHIATAEIEGVVTRIVHTNKAGGLIVYTRNTRDVSLYTPLFVASAAAKLAAYIALPLTKDAKKRDDALRQFQTLIEQAEVSVGNQGKARFGGKPDPEWISVRGS